MTNVVSLELPDPERLSRSQAQAHIRDLVAQGSVSWSTHATDRALERGITTEQVLTCLKKGTVVTDPYKNHRGDFRTEVYRHAAGEEITVAVAINIKKRIVVITTY
ncbi:DUF4258 domain-containing protein [Labrenzia sp. R4_1]|nr:DUF4258 domain-containing protein [Labrenzia sp. R4_1]